VLSGFLVGKGKLVDLVRVVGRPVLIFGEPRFIAANNGLLMPPSSSQFFPSMKTFNLRDPGRSGATN
jgi:hypothetical protein